MGHKKRNTNQLQTETIVGMVGDPTPCVSLPVLSSLGSESVHSSESQICKHCRLWEQLVESDSHGECHLQAYPLAIPAGSLLQSKFIPGIFLVMREAQWCAHFEPRSS